MTIAYLISAHTDAPQLKRLIEALHPDAHYFIHIDKKSDINQFTSIIKGINIHFIEDRVDVRWGTILEVEYQMNLIKAAVEFPTYFERIFFLSGLDYPLWSNEHITDWLDHHRDKEIIQGIQMNTEDISYEQKIMYTTPRPFFAYEKLNNKWNMRLGMLARKYNKLKGVTKPLSFMCTNPVGLNPSFLPMPEMWSLYKGSAWWCISQDLAQHVYESYKRCPEIRKYFLDSFGQAETVIQTIVFNNYDLAKKCIHTRGKYPGLVALTPLHHIVYDPVIKVMDETDYDTLMASGKMFTRKVVSGKSDKLVEMIDNGRK